MSGMAAVTLEECLVRGVREFVVCPGARNAALVLGAARCGVKIWTHFDLCYCNIISLQIRNLSFISYKNHP